LSIIIYENDALLVSEIIGPLALFWMTRTIFGCLVGPTCQAIGNTKLEFKWNVFTFLVTPVIIYLSSKG
ncbi:hypothetical protein, partial [Vibrio campbellii]|uniref:hypothetical protein n=1 Tax=Vibrio campbellii TaxID=680 RepID=UPI001E4FB799